jgi:Cell division protein FtsQ
MGRRRQETPSRVQGWPVQPIGLLIGVGVLVLALLGVGEFTRERIASWDRSTIAFSDIDCPRPQYQDRDEFLAEVRSSGDLPERLPLLEKNLASRLAEAFAQHPWVESVTRVSLSGRKVHIDLEYRVPVLAVLSAEPGDGPGWVVDRQGVVLPRKDIPEKLPILLATTAPSGRDGEPWGDRTIEAAARMAGLLRPHQKELRLQVFERHASGFVLSTADGTHVLWGEAPGSEAAGEATAEEKVKRLLQYCLQYGNLDRPTGRQEHDVRPKAAATHRALPPVE